MTTRPQPYTLETYPRLSTHILLGDHLRERDPSNWLSIDGSCGCAIGGALISAGRAHEVHYGSDGSGSQPIIRIWPWLGKTGPSNPDPTPATYDDFNYGGALGRQIEISRGCYGPCTHNHSLGFIWIISDLFYLVCIGKMTIEALADKVCLWEEEYDDQLRALRVAARADNLRERAGDLAACHVTATVR